MLVVAVAAGGLCRTAAAEDATALIDPVIMQMIVAGNVQQQKVAPLQRLENMLRYSYVHNESLLAARAGMKTAQEKMPRSLAPTSRAMNAVFARRAFLMAQEQDVMRAVASVYMDVSRDVALLDLSQKIFELVEDQRKLTKTDLTKVNTQLAHADAARVAAQDNLQKSRAAFARVIGRPVEEVGEPQLDFPIPGNRDDAVALAEKYNPTMVAMHFLQRARKKDIDLVFGTPLPEDGVSGRQGYQFDWKQGWTQAVNLSHIQEEAAANWAVWRTAYAVVDSRRAEAEAARIARDGVNQEIKRGARTILDALHVDQKYIEAQMALVAAERDAVVATFSLAGTLGMLSPEVLGFSGLKEGYDAHFDDIMWRVLRADVDIAGTSSH